MATGRKSEEKREQVALLLASGLTAKEAAAAAGVAERTVANWRAEDGFRARVVALRSGLMERAVGRLASHMADGAEALHGLLKAESEAVRLGAAKALLELGAKLHEGIDLAQQVQELARELEELKRGTGGPGADGDQAPGGSGDAVGETSPPAGETAPGPGNDPAGGEPAAGPLAGEPAALAFAADAPPLYPPGREEHHGGSARPA
jgi:hypothetical protein